MSKSSWSDRVYFFFFFFSFTLSYYSRIYCFSNSISSNFHQTQKKTKLFWHSIRHFHLHLGPHFEFLPHSMRRGDHPKLTRNVTLCRPITLLEPLPRRSRDNITQFRVIMNYGWPMLDQTNEHVNFTTLLIISHYHHPTTNLLTCIIQ